MGSYIEVANGAIPNEPLSKKVEHQSSEETLCSPVNDNPPWKEILDDVNGAGTEQLRQLQAWNPEPPKAIESCIHDLIHQRFQSQPDKCAVNAWNGDFTYGEVDTLSSSLATHLSDLGVGPETFVPVYFEKSRWTPVVILGVLKAGGAFVLLDPAHPIKRLEEICQTLNAKVLVASPQYATSAIKLAAAVVVVDETTTEWKKSVRPMSSRVEPHNAAYAIFTSGTSGTPKGVVVEHRSFCTGGTAHGAAFNMNSSSRVLQFASYAFDACLFELLTTLFVGGCVCIPSETERRRDLGAAARRFEVNWAFFSPAIARVMEVNDFSTLKTLAIGGEAMITEDIDKWAPHLELFQAYGPSECTPISTVSRCHAHEPNPANIGYSTGATCWIADRDDHDKLTPIGDIGELLIDGPIVGRGYVGNPQKTAEVFVERPKFLSHMRPGSIDRIYKTGDLAKYNEDGSIEYVARKDTQAKLHGQRMELAEVEHHLRRCFSGVNDLAAEIVKPMGEDHSPLLAAFLVPRVQQQPSDRQDEPPTDPKVWLTAPSEEFRSQIHPVTTQLGKIMPTYMVPVAFLTISSIPLSSSNGKIDRRYLREIAGTRTRLELQRYCSSEATKQPPSTPAERAIQELWARVLQIPPEVIGLKDSFWSLGGNSIRAMQLAGAARREGLNLEVGDVWGHQDLEGMVAAVFSRDKYVAEDIRPFSLLRNQDHRNEMIQLASRLCQVEQNEIEDIYPCTSLQEGLMSLTAKRSHAYTIVYQYELPSDTDIDRFRAAWSSTIHANPILRTRMVQASNGEIYQAVVRDEIPWDTLDHGQQIPRDLQDWKLGHRLIRLALNHRESATDKRYFTLVIHHSIVDGWSLKLDLKQVETAYNQGSLRPRPFSPFIEYVSRTRNEVDAFWRDQFKDLNAGIFPALPSPEYTPAPAARAICRIPTESDVRVDGMTIPTKLKLSWGIVNSLYTDSLDVVFGNTVTGRGAPVLGVEEMTGPAIASIPVRLLLDPDETVADALRKVNDQSIATIPFDQAGIQNINRMGPECAAACQYQSFMVIQPPPDDTTLFSKVYDMCDLDAFSTHAIMLQCKLSGGSIELDATFDPHVVDEVQMQRILNHMKHIFQQIERFPSIRLRNLGVMSVEDVSELQTWNGNPHSRLNMCAHEVIYNRCLAQPEAPAICAWDGNFTYRDLEFHSSCLAKHLAHHSVGPEVFVPLYFEKSRWTTIAILGVIKAGGAFVLLDPSHPPQRSQGICQEVRAPLVVTSEANASKAASLVPQVVVLGDREEEWARFPLSVSIVAAKPDNSMYAVFTSGSSGTPKGAVMSHGSWYTSADANRTALSLDSRSRVLQFASYAFDISIADNLLTLLAGGCVCVPSDQDRVSNLVQAIDEFQANWACLTPSVARLLNPDKTPTLQNLLLTGEAMTATDVNLWSSHVHLLNVYGPAECAILTSVTRHVRHDKLNNVGRPTSAVCWIVDAQDHNKLAPIGTVGELIVESPTVSGGYLNEPEKTAALFIETPPWLQHFRTTTSGRFYKTGDLLRYTSDGSMQYIGRKDTQVKLHGQRIELGEIEYCVRQYFPRAKDAVAAVVSLKGHQSATLVAFVLQKRGGVVGDASQEALLGNPDNQFHNDATTALSKLSDALPHYMIPTIFIPLNRLPLTQSGKLNRRLLHDEATALSSEQIEQLNVERASKQAPVTDTQRQLQQLFAKVLQVPSAEISVDEHFFRRGGDSVLAMKLVALAQEAGCSFTVGDVFNQPRLVDLARKINPNIEELNRNLRPFALMKDSIILELVILELLSHGQVTRNQIEDIYPCTPLQEGMMALTARNPGKYVSGADGYIKQGVDIRRFQDAFDTTVLANPIFRTRIAQTVHGSFQVVIRDKIPWEIYESEEDYNARSSIPVMGPNERLLYLALIAPESDGGPYRFVLTIHHALYDGWSLSLLWSQIERAYNGSTLEPRPFSGFIDYISRTEQMDEFWRSQFTDINAAIFPALPSSNYNPMPTAALKHFISDLPTTATEHTMSSAIRLAWSVVISHYTDSNDVVFGSTISGRSAPVVGIDQVTGPTIGTLPFRVQLTLDDTIQDALSAVQKQVTAMIPYEHGGLQNIRKLSKEAATACSFQSQLGVQPWMNVADSSLFSPLGGGEQDYGYGSFASYAFVIVCHLGNKDRNNDIKIAASYDSHIVGPAEAQRMVEQFEHVLRYIIRYPEQPLRAIPTVNTQDMQQLLEWNRTLPSSYDKCLHDLILDHSTSRPDAPAVAAWDGDLTYQELASSSSTLAQRLRARGVEKGSFVPVCFEKTKWCIITILAVLRAGAACVCIDHKHPPDRIRQILKQTKPKTILASPAQKAIFTDEINMVVTVPFSDEDSEDISAPDLPAKTVTPQDPAFIIFTSGSTGQPKGIVMEHANLSTSIRDHSDAMNVHKDTRALHFASYAFDASIYEIFTTLVTGGCVCVPSEEDRMNNLVGFIREHEVNWALFTPSLINGLIRPDQIPDMKTIVVGGEALTQETVDTWASKITLINAYGPAEATICAAGRVPTDGWTTGTIGPVTGGVGWITLPSDPLRLAPVGAVGELVIEGPVVTRGYLNDPEKTAAAYFSHLPWLSELGHPGERGRLYRSGDLVQYTSNGSIRFVGRKDSQVKLRGQRIELSEVEHHVKQCFPDAVEVVAEVVVPVGEHGAPTLIAFVVNKEEDNHLAAAPEKQDLFIPPNRDFVTQAHGATTKLRTLVPSYMVPAAFLQLSQVPRTRSDKVNRLLLRQQAAVMPLEQRREFSTLKSAKREPATEKEETLRALWADVFKMNMEYVGADDDFFQLGGDSITAMKLVSFARRRRLHLAVRSIFDHPVLSELAQTAENLSAHEIADEYRPGSLLGTRDLKSFIKSIPGPPQSFKAEDVADVLPTTELQSQLLKAENVTYIRLSLPIRIDPDRVEAACHAMVRQHSILRTIFMSYQGELIQVVLRDVEFEKFRMNCDRDQEIEGVADTICTQDASSPVPLGVPYLKMWLLSRSESEHMLVLRTTHAQYDGASLPLLLRDLAAAYNGQALYPAGPPFAEFLRFQGGQRTPKAYQFWREYFQGAHLTDLKELCVPDAADSAAEFVIKPMKQIPLVMPPEGVTMATLVKAAWAVVLAELTEQRDVMFGHVFTGRDAPIADVERMAAPLITICPIRVTIQPSWTVMDLLNHVQSQYTQAMPYAHVEFNHIRENATTWPAGTEISSVVTHQNGDQVPTFSLDGVECPWKPWDIGVSPHFHIISFPVENHLVVQLTASSKKFSPDIVEHMLDRMCKNISAFSEGVLKPLAI